MGMIRISDEMEKELDKWCVKMKELGYNISKSQASELFASLGSPKNNKIVFMVNHSHKRKKKKSKEEVLDIFNNSSLFDLS